MCGLHCDDLSHDGFGKRNEPNRSAHEVGANVADDCVASKDDKSKDPSEWRVSLADRGSDSDTSSQTGRVEDTPIKPASGQDRRESHAEAKPTPAADVNVLFTEVVPAQDDLKLLAKFAAVAGLESFDSLVCQRILRAAIWMLRSCEFPEYDICSILAHASVYYTDAIVVASKPGMAPVDAAQIVVALMFLAHCHIEDNTCPLHVWHQHLCRHYCSLPLLTTAVVKLMSMRKWALRVDESVIMPRLRYLLGTGPLPALTSQAQQGCSASSHQTSGSESQACRFAPKVA